MGYHDGRFVVATPNAFVAEMLEQRMYSLISQAFHRVTKAEADLRFEVTPADPSDDDVESLAPSPAENGTVPQPPMPPAPALNYRYTFETFVVGPSNALAHTAAATVAERPGAIYNPLVIHSAVGLGKTHLLHAIGHRLHARGVSTTYATAEQFTNEFIRAIREGKSEDFRRRYRTAEALLLDDVQFLIGKEQTQEDFLHTLDTLHVANRQIVLACDRPVQALALLDTRVRSRLGGGLVVDLHPPDLETRIDIVTRKAALLGSPLPDAVAAALAESPHSTIRDLEGCLSRVIAYASLSRSPVTLDLVRRLTAQAMARPSTTPHPEAILHAVAEYFNIDADVLRARTRRRQLAGARHLAMHILREDAGLGPTAIGRLLGGRNKATVIQACSRFATRLPRDPALLHDVASIRRALPSPAPLPTPTPTLPSLPHPQPITAQ